MTLIKAERTENSTVELEFSVDRETFDKEVSNVYRKQAANITVPGFRKGKAPRSIIERMYGKGVFYEDAANNLLPAAYEEALKASETPVEPVGRAEFDIKSIDENGIVFTAVVPVKPAVTIEGYMGIEAQKVADEVTELEIENELKIVQEQNSREIDVTDAPAANGNTVVIDFDGSIDGVPFDGGKGEDYHLKLGSGSFIPGFEDQIVGHSVGDAFDVRVTFPADYHVSELCGKEAVFAVKLKAIQSIELPALDDDFAKDVSEFDTMDAYKADIKAKIEKRHENAAESVFEETVINALNEKLGGEAIPAAMIDAEVENVVRDYDNRLRMQGLDLNSYLKYTNNSLEQFRNQVRPQAESYVKTRLALEKIAELENITVSDEELEAEYARVAEKYGMEVDKVKPLIPADSLITDLKVKKAMDLVKANTVAPAAKPADAADAE